MHREGGLALVAVSHRYMARCRSTPSAATARFLALLLPVSLASDSSSATVVTGDNRTGDQQDWRPPLAHGYPHGTFSSAGGWSVLADLPPLKKTHHSYRISNFSAADPLHSDFVRITGACPLSLLDDNHWGESMINECVTAAGRFGASLSINHSPWYNHYSSKDKTLAPDCCPEKEAAELSWYRRRLAQTAVWIEQANARLKTNVTVGAVMLDAERWTSTSGKNQSWDAAMTRKHTLMFNATAELLPGVTLQWYDRGGYTYDGMGTGYFAPSPYYTLDEPGTVFSTSLYALGQVGYTREQVRGAIQEL